MKTQTELQEENDKLNKEITRLRKEIGDTRTGNFGEGSVANYYASNGYIVYKSLDPFDNGKDLLIQKDGITLKVEVKTGVPFADGSFLVLAENQLSKITTCDKLIYVAGFYKGNEQHWSSGNVYEVPKKPMRATHNAKLIGKLCFPITEMTELYKITDSNEIAYLKKYSTSTYDPKKK